MGIVSVLLLVIFVISAFLLILLVLIQDEQGEGLGGIFGGGTSTPIGNRSGNILTRTTSILGAIFLVCAFGLAWLNRTPSSGNPEAAARKIEAQQQSGVEWWKTSGNPAPPAQSGQSAAGGATAAPAAATQGAPGSGEATPAPSAAPGATNAAGAANPSAPTGGNGQ